MNRITVCRNDFEKTKLFCCDYSTEKQCLCSIGFIDTAHKFSTKVYQGISNAQSKQVKFLKFFSKKSFKLSGPVSFNENIIVSPELVSCL